MQATDTRQTSVLPNLCRSESVLLLILVGELLALAVVVVDDGLRHFSWSHLGLVSFWVQWVALSSAALLCYLRGALNRLGPTLGVVGAYLLVLLVTAVISVFGQWLFYGTGLVDIDFWRVAESVLLAAIFAGISLRYFYLQQQLNLQRHAELQARLQALQARIRPHFLFNSMNSVASLIAIDPDRAERLVEDMCELFRASLAEATLVPLSEEIALGRRYLAVEQLRLGERLEIDWPEQQLPSYCWVPAMLLQPLLENAIYHGIQPRLEGGQISVRAACDGERIVITVRNPLAQTADNDGHSSGNGMALDNIRHRLSAHYGEDANLKAYTDHGEYLAMLTLPLMPDKTEGDD